MNKQGLRRPTAIIISYIKKRPGVPTMTLCSEFLKKRVNNVNVRMCLYKRGPLCYNITINYDTVYGVTALQCYHCPHSTFLSQQRFFVGQLHRWHQVLRFGLHTWAATWLAERSAGRPRLPNWQSTNEHPHVRNKSKWQTRFDHRFQKTDLTDNADLTTMAMR